LQLEIGLLNRADVHGEKAADSYSEERMNARETRSVRVSRLKPTLEKNEAK